MASSYDNLEKSSLQINNKKKSNYGSLRKDAIPQQQIVQIKHKLVNGETLQGISLKYGVPIENIKRANKLWTNDLALIKDFLLIPIEKEKLNDLNLNDKDSLLQAISLNDDDDNNNNNNSDTNKNSNTNYKDYLSKFDTFLNESKMKLKNLESIQGVNKASNLNDYQTNDDQNDDFLFKNPKINRQDSERKYSYLYANEDLLTTPDFVIKNSNNHNSNKTINNNNYNINNNNITNYRAKHAYETLQKLEKEKDDLFEL